MFRNDEDEGIARSEDQYRTDAKERRKERAAASKGKLLDLQRAVLRANVDKDKVKPDADQKNDGENVKDDTKLPETFGTKTHAQEEKRQVQKADATPDDEQMIEQQRRQDQAKQQAGEEYQADPD